MHRIPHSNDIEAHIRVLIESMSFWFTQHAASSSAQLLAGPCNPGSELLFDSGAPQGDSRALVNLE